MVKDKVSIVVVNWNGSEVLKECLGSLSKINYPKWELIIVDNGSTDNYLEVVFNSSIDRRKIKLVQNKKNFGFAKANNQGVQKADGEFILLLNNDTRVIKSFLTKMVARIKKDSEVGVLQPKIKMMDKRDYLDNAGSFLTRIGFLQHWGFAKKDSSQFDKQREIFSAKGACMLIKREVIDAVGLFDENFVSYFEESDFCFRVWLAGWKVLYYPGTHIFHKVGWTSKKMNQYEVNLHSTKNRIFSLFKNLENHNLFLIFLPHLLIVTFLGFFYLIRLQFKKSWIMFGAIAWNLRNLNLLINARKETQRLRKVRDQEIFNRVMQPLNLRGLLNHFKAVEANFRF